MNPLSPLYFIKENKSRCCLLIFMLFLSYGIYLGGLYVTNPFDNWKYPIEIYEQAVYLIVQPSDDNADNEAQLADFRARVAADGKAELIDMGLYDGFFWETIMGFENGIFSFTFLSAEDFRTYCRSMNIDCDFDSLKSGSMIMSDRFAKNKSLEIGDSIGKDYDENMYGEYTLDAVTEEDGYTLYFIDEDAANPGAFMMLGNGIGGGELYDYADSLQEEYNLFIQQGHRAEIDRQFASLNIIYLFIVIMLSVILAVTINAAFVGMYQRRNYEFAVYRAIGISMRQIIGKIAGELLLIDLIALTAGGAVFFTALYLFNNLVLYPAGKYLRYYNSWALLGLLLCNIMVLVPLILTRCRQMLKTDICEY